MSPFALLLLWLALHRVLSKRERGCCDLDSPPAIVLVWGFKTTPLVNFQLHFPSLKKGTPLKRLSPP